MPHPATSDDRESVSIPFKREGTFRRTADGGRPCTDRIRFHSLQTGRHRQTGGEKGGCGRRESFHSLQTGRHIQTSSLPPISQITTGFHSLQTGRHRQTHRVTPIQTTGGQEVSIPFKREGTFRQLEASAGRR